MAWDAGSNVSSTPASEGGGRLTMEQLRATAKRRAVQRSIDLGAANESVETRKVKVDMLKRSTLIRLRNEIRADPFMSSMLTKLKIEQASFQAALEMEAKVGSSKALDIAKVDFAARISKKLNFDYDGSIIVPGSTDGTEGGSASRRASVACHIKGIKRRASRAPSICAEGASLSLGEALNRRARRTSTASDASTSSAGSEGSCGSRGSYTRRLSHAQGPQQEMLVGTLGTQIARQAVPYPPGRRGSLLERARGRRASKAVDSNDATPIHQPRRISTVMNKAIEDTINDLKVARDEKAAKSRLSEATIQNYQSTADQKLQSDLYQTASLAAPRNDVLMPRSWQRILWDVLMLIVTGFSITAAPLLIAFGGSDGPLMSLSLTCDCLFILGIAVSFLSAYEDPINLVVITSPQHITKRYLTSYFVVDLAAALPIDLLLAAAGSLESDNFKTLLHVNRLLRLLRISKLLRTLSHLESIGQEYGVSNPSLLMLIKLLLAIVLMWHWVACYYYHFAITASTADPTYTPNTGDWFPIPWMRHQGVRQRYVYALQWAVGITCQMMVPQPQNFSQQLYGTFVMMSSVIIMAMVIGSSTTLISDLQKEQASLTAKLRGIERFLKHKHLPDTLRHRILSFYAWKFRLSSALHDETGMLEGLPYSLKLQMELNVHHAVFTRLSLFRNCTREELLMLVQRLMPSMALPGDALMYEGEVAVGLFCLMQGAVEVLRLTEDIENGVVTQRYNELTQVMLATCAFGERTLSADPKSAASEFTVRALRFCELSVLLREDFNEMCELNPKLLEYLNKYVLERDRLEARRARSIYENQTRGSTSRFSMSSSVVQRASTTSVAAGHAGGTGMNARSGLRAMWRPGMPKIEPEPDAEVAEECSDPNASSAKGSSPSKAEPKFVERDMSEKEATELGVVRVRSTLAFAGRGWGEHLGS